MSRWQTEFDNHAFQATWKSLVEKANAASVDDKTVLTSVEELARLQKVIAFLQQIIANADIELIPSSTWGTFNQQATNCLNEITAYENDRNIGHVQNANAHADNLLSYLKPYEIPAQKLGDTYQAAFKAYASTIEAYAKRFDATAKQSYDNIIELEKSSTAANNGIASLKSDIENYRDKLLGDNDDTISRQIDAAYTDFVEKHDELVDYYNETFIDEENSKSIRTTIKSIQTAIEGNKGTVETLTNEVQAKVSAINAFSTKVFGEDAESAEPDKESLEFKLDDLIGKLSTFEVAQKRRYEELNKQIEGLLPGATNAALASAYGDMKDTFNEPIKSNTHLFFKALAGIFALTVILFLSDTTTINGWSISYKPINLTDNNLLISFAYKLPFYVPFIWLAYYASKRRSEAQRLQQEYAHKESLAKSYDSYKKQIDELGESAQGLQATLISRAVDVIAYNASSTLDGKHGDKMPLHELAETLKDVKDVLPKIKGV